MLNSSAARPALMFPCLSNSMMKASRAFCSASNLWASLIWGIAIVNLTSISWELTDTTVNLDWHDDSAAYSHYESGWLCQWGGFASTHRQIDGSDRLIRVNKFQPAQIQPSSVCYSGIYEVSVCVLTDGINHSVMFTTDGGGGAIAVSVLSLTDLRFFLAWRIRLRENTVVSHVYLDHTFFKVDDNHRWTLPKHLTWKTLYFSLRCF